MDTICLFCCNTQISKATSLNGKQEPKCGWKPCIPKELIAIWLIITFILFLIIHCMSQHPYQIPQTISNINMISQDEAIHFSSTFSHYIHKNYTLLQQSPKNLIFIYIIGIEGTGHHFLSHLFNNLVEYHRYKSLNYTIEPHYYHQVCAVRHGLLYNLMQDCFQYNQYGEKDPFERLKNMNDSKYKIHNMSLYRNSDGTFINSCDGVQKAFNELSIVLINNSVLFHAGFSYPFGDPFGNKQLRINQYPDIIKLVQWAQNSKPYPFDLRFIVLKRYKWSTALQSVISRYCNKLKRIQYIKLMLSIIQTDLLAIDNQFWIIINFDHLLQYPMEYIPLLVKYLFKNIDSGNMDWKTMENNLKYVLEMTLKNKPISGYVDDDVHRDKCRIGSNQLNELIHNLRIDSPYEWPIFNQHKFIVMPNNTQFLNQKYFIQ
eukprot:133552_1